MQTLPEFTIKDLSKKPDADYANLEGENRVFTMFNPISSAMTKLKEEDKFTYEDKLYQIKMRISADVNNSKNVRFNCLKIGAGRTKGSE